MELKHRNIILSTFILVTMLLRFIQAEYKESVDGAGNEFQENSMESSSERRKSTWTTDGPDPDVPLDKVNCKEGEWDLLAKEESVKFALDKKKCKIYILGSKADNCTAEITCTGLNFKDCEGKSNFFRVYDGLGGEVKLCGKQSIGGPYRASNDGRDLFIEYEGRSPNTVCQVVCGEDKLTQTCGIKDLDSSLHPNAHERSTANDDFPWMAAIVYRNTRRHVCGGSLINAHCFASHTNLYPEQIDIVLHAHVMDLKIDSEYVGGVLNGAITAHGSHGVLPGIYGNNVNVTDAYEQSIRRKVKDVRIHPFWSKHTLDYDVSLLELEEPVSLDSILYGTICLPSLTDKTEYANINATVAGWGRPQGEAMSASSRLLHVAEIPIIGTAECKKLLPTPTLTPRMMCAGLKEGGMDACGDSGGPLVVKINSKHYREIGIVSFGIGCGQPNSPGVYTNIQEILQWIHRETLDSKPEWCHRLTAN